MFWKNIKNNLLIINNPRHGGTNKKMERTLIIMKPDAVQRNLLGDIIQRFEKKGLKIVGLKMMQLDDVLLREHYLHHVDRPFFKGLSDFMKSSPVVVMALEGVEAIDSVRLIVGPTNSRKADAGSIRGDFSMSMQCNIIHASDSAENAKDEIKRFFDENEVFSYKKITDDFVYAGDEK
jgi:nucleoside-diphosphate kinase